MSVGAPARTVLLARHGEGTWTGRRFAGHTDTPLTDAGRAGAAALAATVAASGMLADPRSFVVASDLSRALDTARAVADACGRRLHVDPRWREVSFGSLEGLTFDEARGRWPELRDRLDAGVVDIDWPGGETWAALRARAAAAWRDVDLAGTNAMVVSHGIVIRSLLSELLGAADPRDALPALGPAAAVAVRETASGWRLTTGWESAAGAAATPVANP